MFKELKMKIAARRVERSKQKKAAAKKSTRKSARPTVWSRVWNAVCWPFRKLVALCRHIWSWIRSIDLIALVNLTLLIAIIVLFSMLIIDIVNCRKKPVVVVAEPVPVVATKDNATQPVKTPTVRKVAPRKVSLPIAQDVKSRKMATTVNVVPVKKCETTEKQTAKVGNTLYGDIVIDNRGAATILHNGVHVQGNLYLQNMRKYTLPCDIRIDGNLFLRDLNMLQFCGDFTITGNIYVSPRSSFGPIPRTARLGGQVIL